MSRTARIVTTELCHIFSILAPVIWTIFVFYQMYILSNFTLAVYVPFEVIAHGLWATLVTIVVVGGLVSWGLFRILEYFFTPKGYEGEKDLLSQKIRSNTATFFSFLSVAVPIAWIIFVYGYGIYNANSDEIIYVNIVAAGLAVFAYCILMLGVAVVGGVLAWAVFSVLAYAFCPKGY
jgi:hypothetical protein